MDAGHSRGPPPPTCPRRRPHPLPQGHWSAQSALPQLPRQPDLARNRCPSRGFDRLDPNPGLRRAPTRPQMGTQTFPFPPARRSRPHHPHRPTTKTPATPALALEPPHRHRLDQPPHHLNKPHTSPTEDPENRRQQRRKSRLPQPRQLTPPPTDNTKQQRHETSRLVSGPSTI